MRVIRSSKKMQAICLGLKRKGRKIAFVPTMGALHEGHLSLVRRARKLGDTVVVSVFVNPTQFAPGEDFARYPRPLSADKRLLATEKVDLLFLPTASDIYSTDHSTFVDVEEISSILEGAARPGHFRGVATVVAKLLNIVCPDVAVFGQKDGQQVAMIKSMVRHLNFPARIVVAPTVRERSGLAMSSRNRYFNQEQLSRASCIHRGMRAAEALAIAGEVDPAEIEAAARSEIEPTPGVRIDYIAILDPDDLRTLDRVEGKAGIFVAVWLDGVRLIDNIIVRPSRRGRK
jgi:pantoate--beta-alanine ligase